MVPGMSLQSESQKLAPDAFVSLFSLDTTSIGGPVLYFTPGRVGDAGVVYNGVTYTPTDVEFTGLEITGAGALPVPHIKIPNTQGLWQSVITTYGDLLGCTLTRLRTYARFLDGAADADPLAFYGPDIFRVERKVAQNPVFIEWELSASIDQEGVKLPRRVVVRDTCLFRYRSWNGTSFDYTKAICPYAGSSYFDINDQPVTDPAQDVPSRRKSCCVARFGEGNPLPFGGFPGVQRSS